MPSFDQAGLTALLSAKPPVLKPYTPPDYLGVEYLSDVGRHKGLSGYKFYTEARMMKPCKHRKIVFLNHPVSFLRVATLPVVPSQTVFWYTHTRLSVYFSNWITDSDLVTPSPDMSFSGRAWLSMQPRFEGEISMLNFLWELKDFRDIAKYALKLEARRDFQRWLRDLRKIPARIANAPGKTAASAHLVNSFAISPLLADMLSIHKMLLSCVDEAQSAFANSGSTYQKTHYTESVDQNGSFIPGVQNNSNYLFMQYGNATRDRLTATLRYTYKYNVRDKLAAFARYWGLNLSAEAIWNCIPFSFLADYFLTISRSLHAQETDPNVLLTDHQYAESAKRTLYAGAVGLVDPKIVLRINDIPVDAYDFQPISGYFGTAYHRYLCQPNRFGMFVPRPKWPRTKQVLNIAALARCFL